MDNNLYSLFSRALSKGLLSTFPARVGIGIPIGLALDGLRMFVAAYQTPSDFARGLDAVPLYAEIMRKSQSVF